jgi:maltose alpha-D-glucosyltransferase/alpha-amylase
VVVDEPVNPILHGVMYEIYIRSYSDHSGDGTGDFLGIVDRLDYISRLGVSSILLNCPFLSVHGKDHHPLLDWMKLDHELGTLSDFLLLLEKAHMKGLKVLLSLPVNATSDQHVWFSESRLSRGSLFSNSYFWSDTPPPEPETRHDPPEKINWTLDADSGRYYWFGDHKDEPSLNYGDAEVLSEMCRIFEHWFALEVDGFRLAGAGRLHSWKKNEIIPVQDPFQTFHPVIYPLKKSYPEKMFLFETGSPPSKRGQVNDSRLFYHFNPFFPAVISAIKNEDRSPLEPILDGKPKGRSKKSLSRNRTIHLRERSEETFELLDTLSSDDALFPLAPDLPEDRPILSRVARLMENGRRRIQLVMSLFLTFPGLPVLYYGDEIGMGDHPHLRGKNPIRTPMHWSADRNAGFSRADPEELFNPVIEDPLYSYQMVNVESQERFPDSHLWNVRRMIEVRNQNPLLYGDGDFELIETRSASILAYVRSCDGATGLFIHNLSKSAMFGHLDLAKWHGYKPREMFSGGAFPTVGKAPYLITMTPYSTIWFLLEAPIRKKMAKSRRRGS